MKTYEWKSVETGEIIDHDHYAEPPALPGTWRRVYVFGVASVQGAGGSKARQSRRFT